MYRGGAIGWRRAVADAGRVWLGNGRVTMTAQGALEVPARAGVDGTWAVETHGLTKRFGDNVAVDDVELLIPRGCAFGYLGPNGAGKTTLIRVLLGLTHADAGHDVAARAIRFRDIATWRWRGSVPSSTSRGSTAI